MLDMSKKNDQQWMFSSFDWTTLENEDLQRYLDWSLDVLIEKGLVKMNSESGDISTHGLTKQELFDLVIQQKDFYHLPLARDQGEGNDESDKDEKKN